MAKLDVLAHVSPRDKLGKTATESIIKFNAKGIICLLKMDRAWRTFFVRIRLVLNGIQNGLLQLRPQLSSRNYNSLKRHPTAVGQN